MKQVVFHPDADAEISEATQYYEERKPGLGYDFLGEMERALDQISANPEACQLIGKRVRRKILWRFPYNLEQFSKVLSFLAPEEQNLCSICVNNKLEPQRGET